MYKLNCKKTLLKTGKCLLLSALLMALTTGTTVQGVSTYLNKESQTSKVKNDTNLVQASDGKIYGEVSGYTVTYENVSDLSKIHIPNGVTKIRINRTTDPNPKNILKAKDFAQISYLELVKTVENSVTCNIHSDIARELQKNATNVSRFRVQDTYYDIVADNMSLDITNNAYNDIFHKFWQDLGINNIKEVYSWANSTSLNLLYLSDYPDIMNSLSKEEKLDLLEYIKEKSFSYKTVLDLDQLGLTLEDLADRDVLKNKDGNTFAIDVSEEGTPRKLIEELKSYGLDHFYIGVETKEKRGTPNYSIPAMEEYLEQEGKNLKECLSDIEKALKDEGITDSIELDKYKVTFLRNFSDQQNRKYNYKQNMTETESEVYRSRGLELYVENCNAINLQIKVEQDSRDKIQKVTHKLSNDSDFIINDLNDQIMINTGSGLNALSFNSSWEEVRKVRGLISDIQKEYVDLDSQQKTIRKIQTDIHNQTPNKEVEDEEKAETPEKMFTDVPDNAWYIRNLKSQFSKKIINGYPDNTFRPTNKMNVDAFVKTTIATLGYEIEKGDGYWAQPFIDTAIRDGIISEGQFDNYARPITRGEMAQIATAVLEFKGIEIDYDEEEIKSNIKDFDEIPEDQQEAVLKAYSKGILNGYPDGTFKPNGSLTRAETTVVIDNIDKKIN